MFELLSNDLIEHIFDIYIVNQIKYVSNISINYIIFFYRKYINILLINKNFNKIIKKLLNNKLYYIKYNFIKTFNLPSYILNIFNKKNIYTIPFIKFTDKFLGYTDCIDNIKNNDVTHDIMIGFDYFKRPFFTFKFKYKNIKTKKIKKKITILYQRYNNNSDYWILESYYSNNFHNFFSNNINFNYLKNIVNGKKNKI